MAVEKGGLLVNMDSAAPNLAAGEWLASGGLLAPVKLIKPECTYGNSRFDFYVESEAGKMWLEVKGVTLETQRTALFPDAPSLRALKHVEELIQAKENGYEAGILFVVCLLYTSLYRKDPAYLCKMTWFSAAFLQGIIVQEK